MFFVKCAWKDTRCCYHFSTFGPISMDCSQACKVFSSWRKQLFWMWLQELHAGAQRSLQHKKLSSTWSFGWASSRHLLHGFLIKRQGGGKERESKGGLHMEFRLPVKYLDELHFPDLPLHNTGALCQCAVRWGVQALAASAEYLY